VRGWLAASGLLSLGCSLTYGDPPSEQCESDADCRAVGLADAVCDVEHGVCVDSASPANERAPDSSESAALLAACAAPGGPCPLLSAECTRLAGDFADPDAVIIGTLSPHTFGAGQAEPLSIPYVSRWLDTIELGLAEWQAQAPGGRLEGSRRPLALLHCNSGDDLPQARRAMGHLIDVAAAPVVLTLNDNDTEWVRHQALRRDTTVICASCFSVSPEIEDNRLLWQVSPPLVTQAELAQRRIDELSASVRAARGIAPEAPLEIVVLSQPYRGIDAYVAELSRLAAARGGYHLSQVAADPASGTLVQVDVARAVIALAPPIIAVAMDSDFTTYYLRMIEAEWPADAPRPEYVLTHLNQEAGLFADIVRGDDGLRRRLSGTGFALDTDVAENLARLEQRFALAHGASLDNTHYGYDAFYAALYALALADQTRALSGAEISAALGRLSAGPTAHVGPEALRSSLGFLASGQTLDLVGASNRLDWDPLSHQTSSDVALWCLSRAGNGELRVLADAGLRWHGASGEVSGRFDCP
jgi:hypothetical protein